MSLRRKSSRRTALWLWPWVLLAALHAPWLMSGPSGAAQPVLAAYAPQTEVSPSFSICGAMPRRNCVVDGDIFYLGSEKIRIADIDTPEIAQPQCLEEEVRGQEATLRLQELLNAGSFSVERKGRDKDRYGRKLRVVSHNGGSVGDAMIAEGLAHKWRGRKESWCG